MFAISVQDPKGVQTFKRLQPFKDRLEGMIRSLFEEVGGSSETNFCQDDVAGFL